MRQSDHYNYGIRSEKDVIILICKLLGNEKGETDVNWIMKYLKRVLRIQQAF